MADIFQFYSSSADAAPGKGTGETLASASASALYSDLKKVPNWRRTLATLKSLGKEELLQNLEATTILPLTQTA